PTLQRWSSVRRIFRGDRAWGPGADKRRGGPDAKEMIMITRRYFMRASAIAMAGVGLAPAWLARAAAQGTGKKKILVAIFQRGAADGLNIVVPFFEKAYYDMRPTIAVPRPGKNGGAIDLDERFALHPS